MSSLFLAPHNDDETLFGTFTLLRHYPHVVVCLRSFRMADPTYPGGKPVDYLEREYETERAMQFLGCTWEQWTFPDNAVDWNELEDHLRMMDESPLNPPYERVFAPCIEIDGNLHHNLLGRVALSVFAERLTPYLTYTSNGKSRGQEVEFEPEWIALKHAALACYTSQAAHPATRSHFLEDLLEYQVAPQ